MMHNSWIFHKYNVITLMVVNYIYADYEHGVNRILYSWTLRTKNVQNGTPRTNEHKIDPSDKVPSIPPVWIKSATALCRWS